MSVGESGVWVGGSLPQAKRGALRSLTDGPVFTYNSGNAAIHPPKRRRPAATRALPPLRLGGTIRE